MDQDPMDYAMDDNSNQANAAQQHQCQPQPQPGLNSSASQGRIAANPHYNYPIPPFYAAYNSSYHPLYYGSARFDQHPAVSSPYSAPRNTSQWTRDSVPGPGSSWQAFGDAHHPTAVRGGPDSSRGFPAIPSWIDQPRALNPFGGAFSNQLDVQGVPQETGAASGGGSSVPSSVRPSMFSHLPPGYELPRTAPFEGPGPTNAPANLPPNESDRGIRLALTTGAPPTDPLRTGIPRVPRALRHGRNDGNDESAAERRLNAGWDSDDEGSILEMEDEAIRRETARETLYHELEDERHLAAMRGALAGGKRLPSKEALASLESVKVEDLTENEKTCIICYNEFGVSNPEGIIEQPTRLPKCKHLFGDKCIKKWFEDSDSCPYCRDKLPSELVVKKSGMESSMRMVHRERLRLAQLGQRAARHNLAPHVGFFPEESSASRTATLASQRYDDYEFMVNRHSDSWGYSPPNRYSSGESPERRRQARGRVGNGRPGHLLGRPTSVGSARSISQSFNHHQIPPHQRSFGPPMPPLHPTTPRRSITPGLPRFNSTNQGSSSHPAESPSSSSSGSSEEASPPVAVGTGVTSQRIQFDVTSNLPRNDWRASSRQQSHQTGSNRSAHGYSTDRTSQQATSESSDGGSGNGRENEATNSAQPRWSR